MLVRVISGLFLAIIALAAVFYLPNAYFGIAALLLTFWASWEWSVLIPMRKTWHRVLYLLGAFVFAALATMSPSWMLLISLVFWLLIVVMLISPLKKIALWQSRIFLSVLGWILLSAAWLSMVWLHQQKPILLFDVILIVALADSGAYFTGRFLGKHHLAPNISPKKTWEGLIGGLVLSVIGGLVVFHFMPQAIQAQGYFWWSMLTVILALISVCGDLFESFLKRQVGIKDSGSALPGHGGILDRIDGLMAALPIMCMAILIAYSAFFVM